MSSVVEAQGRFRMTDGFDLFYRNWRSTGEIQKAVLALHGIEAHSGALGFVANELAMDGSDVYAIDRRGLANSKEVDRPRGDTRDFGRHLEDVDETVGLIRRIHPGKKFFMFGHSIGCGYTLRYADFHPELVNGIILAAPPVETVKLPVADRLGLLFRPRTMYDLLERFPAAVRQSEEFRILTQDPLCTKNFSGRFLIKTQTTLFTKMIKHASKTRTPTLILHGEADILALPNGARRLFESLAAGDKSIRTFPGADHWFYQSIIPTRTSKYGDEQRRQVSRPIVEWLRAR